MKKDDCSADARRSMRVARGSVRDAAAAIGYGPRTASPGRFARSRIARPVLPASATWDSDQAWSAQLNVRNLFDRSDYANIVYQAQLIYGDPRDLEPTLSWTF